MSWSTTSFLWYYMVGNDTHDIYAIITCHKHYVVWYHITSRHRTSYDIVWRHILVCHMLSYNLIWHPMVGYLGDSSSMILYIIWWIIKIVLDHMISNYVKSNDNVREENLFWLTKICSSIWRRTKCQISFGCKKKIWCSSTRNSFFLYKKCISSSDNEDIFFLRK